MLLKMAFIFLLVGYGTKAGLAPMHNWLPDAHSQAPAPVSALFSGFLLNTALYCILRYVPLVEAATGNVGWGLRAAGGLRPRSPSSWRRRSSSSSTTPSACWPTTASSTWASSRWALGLGGLGIFAALFHTLNHSLCKTLAFFSAGRLGQMYGTHDMRGMAGAAAPVAGVGGAGCFGSLLALIGVAPFALFMSEFQILKAAVDARAYVAMVLFLLGTGVVFVGALRHAIALAWGDPVAEPAAVRAGWRGPRPRLRRRWPLWCSSGSGCRRPLRAALGQAAARRRGRAAMTGHTALRVRNGRLSRCAAACPGWASPSSASSSCRTSSAGRRIAALFGRPRRGRPVRLTAVLAATTQAALSPSQRPTWGDAIRR